MALHTMAILQAYQADVLKEMDEGTGLTPEAVKELRRATDLALRATKHTARAVGRSMAASVAAERHLWLNLTETAEAFLPAPNALSSLKSVTATLRGLVCRSSSPSFLLGLAVGGRVRLSPFAARPLAAGEPHVRTHSCFSPAVYRTRAGHPSAQHFSFTVEGAAASRPSRHPISGMSSLTRHSDSSVALPSRMGASTRGIAVGSPHNSNRLHSWKKSPRFDGVHLTVVNSASKASVLQQELSSLLQKGAIEEVPQSEVERGFFSRYFLVPKRDGGLRPILDLRHLNLSLYKGKFKMLTMRTIMSQFQEGDWFVTIDLKDAYFHIQVVHRHRR